MQPGRLWTTIITGRVAGVWSEVKEELLLINQLATAVDIIDYRSIAITVLIYCRIIYRVLLSAVLQQFGIYAITGWPYLLHRKHKPHGTVQRYNWKWLPHYELRGNNYLESNHLEYYHETIVSRGGWYKCPPPPTNNRQWEIVFPSAHHCLQQWRSLDLNLRNTRHWYMVSGALWMAW